MPRLFLLRHAEPAAGWGGDALDPGLTERGRDQAAAAAAALGDYGTLLAISSPMLRCRETAAPYLERIGGAARIEARVSEVVAPAGVEDRQSWLRATFPWDDGVARNTWANVAPALLAWRDDALCAMREVERDSVVFTHFIAINAIVSAATNSADTIVFRPGHCSITELEASPSGVRVIRLGEEMRAADVR